jgi:hypothetical protein
VWGGFVGFTDILNGQSCIYIYIFVVFTHMSIDAEEIYAMTGMLHRIHNSPFVALEVARKTLRAKVSHNDPRRYLDLQKFRLLVTLLSYREMCRCVVW